jgi:Plasma-membrane choline transporter
LNEQGKMMEYKGDFTMSNQGESGLSERLLVNDSDDNSKNDNVTIEYNNTINNNDYRGDAIHPYPSGAENGGSGGVGSRSNDLEGGGHDEHNITVNQVLQGEKQPNQYRDVWAAVLFVAHLISIFYIGFAWGIPSLNYESTSESSGYTTKHHYGGIFILCLLSSIAALFIIAGALFVMTRNAHQLIQFSLLFSVGCDAILVMYFISAKIVVGIILSIIALIVAIWYASSVWRRIPFAASNLETALTAVRTNGGITFVAFGITIAINMIFSVVWLLAWLGVYVRFTAKGCQQHSSDAATEDGSCFSHVNPIVVALFLLSYYWTSEVGRNLLHVTVSGVVGTWWFAPDEATTFFSPAISDSFLRATTYSAGSICLGSLLTASLQVLHSICSHARRYGRGSLLLCVLECLSRFLERIVAYFNKWAYGTYNWYSIRTTTIS